MFSSESSGPSWLWILSKLYQLCETCRSLVAISANLANLPLYTSFIKFYVAIATFKNPQNMTVLERASKQDGQGKGRLKVLSYVPMYN